MACAIWTGTISFGLVTVPVKLYSAVDRKSVRFHQLSGKTGVRVSQKRVDPSSGEEVAYADIVKGYELAPDRYVVVEPGELDALEPRKTKTIEIEEFVALSEIDPVYYDHRGDNGTHAVFLLNSDGMFKLALHDGVCQVFHLSVVPQADTPI